MNSFFKIFFPNALIHPLVKTVKLKWNLKNVYLLFKNLNPEDSV